MLKSFSELSKEINKLMPYEMDFNIDDYITEEDVKEWSYEGITEALQREDDIFNVEIVDYHNAMEYLMKEDPSLIESFDLLEEYGYQIHNSHNTSKINISSKLMASLLASKRRRDAWAKISNKVDKLAEYYKEYLDKVDDVSAFVNTLYEYQGKSKTSLEMHIYLSPYDKYKDLIIKCMEEDDMDYLLSKIIDEEIK